MEMMELKIKLVELVKEMDSLVMNSDDNHFGHELIVDEVKNFERLVVIMNNKIIMSGNTHRQLIKRSKKESIYIPNLTGFRWRG